MKENRDTVLPFGTGPIASSLDAELKRHKVERQAYHGKAFVGNHVHKCCQVRHNTCTFSVKVKASYRLEVKNRISISRIIDYCPLRDNK